MILDLRDNANTYTRLLMQRAKLSSHSVPWVVRMNLKELSFAFVRELKKMMPNKGKITSSNLARMKSGGKGLDIPRGVYDALAEKYRYFKTGDGWRFVKTTKRGKFKLSTTTKVRGRTIRQADGTKVKVAGKNLNFQQLAVRRELARREQARGFMAHTAGIGIKAEKILPEDGTASIQQEGNNRFGPKNYVSALEWKARKESGSAIAVFKWGNMISTISGSAARGFSKAKLNSALARAMRQQGHMLREKIRKEMWNQFTVVMPATWRP